MHKVLVNRLGGLSLTRKSVVRLIDRPDMASDVYRGRKTTKQQQQQKKNRIIWGGCGGRGSICVYGVVERGAVTFGNPALLKDRYIVYD